jgi:hypothetical protein
VAGDSGGLNPSDGVTYFSGTFAGSDPTTGETSLTLNVPLACRVVGATIQTIVAGTLGSGESATFSIRINGTTNQTLSTAVTFAAANTVFNLTGLAIVLAKGDQLQLRAVMPTFVTNPTVVLYQCTLLMEPT